ncbi:hypothetical protein GCM10010302_10650 [Streptomyces polychromogenes]|uniref:Uncharacterized protein n=1 Tax=Streptomyces polychromogenes TaxID=67342 RepID=A0ABN0V4P4_9ACTN
MIKTGTKNTGPADNSLAEHARRVAAVVTAQAVGEEWRNRHHMALAFFPAGARSSHEEEHHARRLDEWQKKIVDCLEADAEADAELTAPREQLQGWILWGLESPVTQGNAMRLRT